MKPRVQPANWNCGTGRGGTPGFVLIGVLIVILLISMVALSLMFRLRAEETAAAAGAGGEQAWTAAMSGVQEAMRVAQASAPGDLEWQDAPELFRERLVFDDGSERWYFTVYSMGEPDHTGVQFGLTDEAGKLDLNHATEEMLVKIPRVTPYLAQGLLDFLDADNLPHPEGAEQEYYDNLARPYTILNGPLSTLDELLLVRGFTPSLLYGEDANLNFQLDPNEDDGDDHFPPDNGDGRLDCGLRPLLTVSSYDLNQDNDGVPRTDINSPEEALAENGLPPSLAQYITALRRDKVRVGQPADLLEAKGKFKDDKGVESELESGVGKKELAVVLDKFTTRIEYRLPGLINVNTAAVAVLQTVPEIDQALAEAIVMARRNLRPEQRRTPAWLYEEDLVDGDRFKKIAPYVTARSFQYHLQVIGYGLPSGRYRVLEAIIDLGGDKPAITYLRDLTRLGLPFKIEKEEEAGTKKVAALGRESEAWVRSRSSGLVTGDQRSSFNPEGIRIIQPRVARNELPWDNHSQSSSTLNGLNRVSESRIFGRCPTRRSSCGSSSPANSMVPMGAIDSTLSGLVDSARRLPRVARSSQPWAECWNPFRIQEAPDA